MKKLSIFSLALLAAAATLTGCKKASAPAGKFAEYFAGEEAVNLNDLIRIYEKYEESEKNGTQYDVLSALLGKNQEAYDYTTLFGDTDFAIHLPQYAGSRQPFLSRAEEFYNTCQYAFNIWTDFDIWTVGIRDYSLKDSKEIISSIKGISDNVVRDKQTRTAAKLYKDKLLRLMGKNSYDDEEADSVFSASNEALGDMSAAIEREAYKFYGDEDRFIDSLHTMRNELDSITAKAYNEYVRTDSLKRVGKMLRSLNACETFDEQCSLLQNWANNELSMHDDEWIVAVAYRLLGSGKYNPSLNDVWIMWRSLFQQFYCGSSHSSSIPNDFYNGLRRKCYLTCLKRIEQHPGDVFAMNCAASIGGRTNLDRFGQYPFGNQAAADEMEILPGRWEE